ncbi:MAG TPA: BTAD domain-containing putative transcriptional regulator [Paucimonas sp.]|nr:BTAD domain-containing putative transcriptional regulator [Paucimonas sp.]
MRQSDLPVKYAKLSHPRVHDALPRPRLFRQLDSMRGQHAVTWLAAPPGAGKTTVAASYIVANRLDSVWFQIDQGDEDPATFFYFLAEAVRDSRPALPWLAQELANDVPRFARLFFRQFFARLPADTVVVFDNIQEFDWDDSGDLMEIAFGEVPEGITIFALSRDPPPPRLARLELQGRLATLDWRELRFDADEARALAKLEGAGDQNSLAWLDRIDGWAAGIIMLREHLNKHADEQGMPLLEGREAIFRYFASEILERMPKPWQRVLLQLSHLPGVSAKDAEHVTGDSSAGRILSQLFHNRWFVERRGTDSLTYHFHALFREFLQYEAEQRLTPAERVELLGRAAALLEEQGRCDEAARLYRDAHAHGPLTQLLLRNAGRILAAGRGQSWREWMSWLPQDIVDSHPWLWYWHGVSLNYADPPLGRQVLGRAEQAFRTAGDTPARLLAVAAILDGIYYEWADFSPIHDWIDVMLEALDSQDLDALDPATDLKIHSRLLLGLFLTAPDSPLLPPMAERVQRALPHAEHLAEQLAAGSMLLHYLNWANAVAARQLLASMSHLADNPAIGPYHRIWWLRPAVFRAQHDGNHEAATEMLATAKQLADDFGLDHMQFNLNYKVAVAHLIARDFPAALKMIERMRQSLTPARKLDHAYVRILESSYLSQTGDLQGGLRAAQDSVRLNEEARLPAVDWCQLDILLACSYAQAGDIAAAKQRAELAVEHTYGASDRALVADAQCFVAAYGRYLEGNENGALDILRELFRDLGQRPGLSLIFHCSPHITSVLFMLALRAGIETEQVRHLIVRQRLTAPDRYTPDWPRPVAVRSFGKLELSLNGELVAASGKAQQRPLSLLKALLVVGDGGRPQQSLAALLWPDADDGKAALSVTVHRLRKLVGNDDAILVADGRIRLSETKVWTDVSALMHLCEQVDALPADAPATDINRHAVDLFNLYRGPFCDGDEDGWLIPARDQWRQRFLALVVRLGKRLEALSRWSAAQQLYLRALDAEPLAEQVYQGLMRCAHAQNDPSAAFSAYRRCRDTIAKVLGQAPSVETEKLAQALGLK